MRTTNKLINTLINYLVVGKSYSTKSATWRQYPTSVKLIPTDKSMPIIEYRYGHKHFSEHFLRVSRLGNTIHRNK
jgi:hypothetical protein